MDKQQVFRGEAEEYIKDKGLFGGVRMSVLNIRVLSYHSDDQHMFRGDAEEYVLIVRVTNSHFTSMFSSLILMPQNSHLSDLYTSLRKQFLKVEKMLSAFKTENQL